MNWDRVRREDQYARGGTQSVAGSAPQNKPSKNKLGFKAKYPGKCGTCKKSIQVGQMIVFFKSMKSPVHRRCV